MKPGILVDSVVHPRLSMPRLGRAVQSARLLPQSGRWQCPNHSLTSRRHSSQVAPVVKTPFFEVSAEVQDALFAKRPIVALETAIYTHGFPRPDNRLLAAELEAIVRDRGAVPATIGVVQGVARIGISAEQMAILSNSAGDPDTMKLSRRDIPYIMGMSIVGKKLNGGTTISGTMMLARKVGIDVIGTGGLGGVHRGAQDTMDISADLTELGRTSVAVVSSGCKSFLDLPRTLEYLETQGVGVFTYADGRTKDIDFPSFFTRDSGIKSPMVFQSAREAAAIIRSQNVLSRYNRSGFLFANPIPEEYSIPKDKIDKAIDQAVQEAAEQGIHGHANTPFILKRIKELTEGNSIPANRALIASNVAMATDIAVELAKLNAEYSAHAPETSTTPGIASVQVRRMPEPNPLKRSQAQYSVPKILVFGSVAVDLACNYIPPRGVASTDESVPDLNASPRLLTSNIASIEPSIGGVGHNVALAAHRVSEEQDVRLCSIVADDIAGKSILTDIKQEGMDSSGIVVMPSKNDDATTVRTAQYVAVNDGNKNLVMAMADMALLSGNAYEPYLRNSLAAKSTSWIVADANWNHEIFRKIVSTSKQSGAKIAFEPVSVAKSAAIFPQSSSSRTKLGIFPSHSIDLATPNQHELASMHASAKQHEYFEADSWWKAIDALGIPSSGARDRFVSLTSRKLTDEGIPLQSIQLLPIIPTILTKLGADGVLLTSLLRTDDPRLRDPDSAPFILSRNTNGDDEIGGVYMRLFPAIEKVQEIVSVNGVGDTFLGVLIAGLARGCALDEHLIGIAQKGAVMTLKSSASVSPDLGILKKELRALEANGR